MDPVQILLFVVVSVLTGLLLAVGIQAFLILHDVKKSIKKFNQLLDDAQVFTNTVARPVQGLTHLIEGVKNIKNIVDFTTDLVNKKEPAVNKVPSVTQEQAYQYQTQMEDEEAQAQERASMLLGAEKVHPIHKVQERGRRFFHRSGKPLTS